VIASLVLGAEKAGFEAPHKWLPEGYEIILGTIAFAVIFGALWKFAGPAAKTALKARTARIQAELDKSAAAKAGAQEEAGAVKRDLAGAESEAAQIVADAKAAAAQMKTDQLARIDVELAELRQKATADLATMRARSLSEVQGSVAQLAVGAAEQVVVRNLNQETQYELVEKFIEQVGRMTPA
jgi:F-type H+-transporting ATPase subunit b